MKSLDPRVNRLPFPEHWGELQPKQAMDQLETFEVFHQSKPEKAFEHAGSVHAPNNELAFVFGKEQYSRRGGTCSGIWTVSTQHVMVSPFTEGETSLYDLFEGKLSGEPANKQFEIFHLRKRGKQHVHVGSVMAAHFDDALTLAQQKYREAKPVFNVWIIESSQLHKSTPEEVEIWNTLHEKKYRDAIDYKAQGKIDQFKAEQAQQH